MRSKRPETPCRKLSNVCGRERVSMRLLRQLEFVLVGQALRLPKSEPASDALSLQFQGLDPDLERQARELLRTNGANRIAMELRVEWNSRPKTAAGRADCRQKLISLNPRLLEHPAEIDRTLRHELAHLLAQFRAGRRRVLPHGEEWQQACRDLGIKGEKRCHSLPFPTRRYVARFIYRCPNCRQEFPRLRRVRR